VKKIFNKSLYLAGLLAHGRYPSHLHNKLVAEAFYLTNNIEKYGSGFIRIRKALQDYPEAAFEIQEMGVGVLLTFARTGARQPEESGATPQQRSEKILGLLRQSPTMTTNELAQQLGISQRAIEKQIDKQKNTA
jgi:ATP-dependent DNA helicase RecG